MLYRHFSYQRVHQYLVKKTIVPSRLITESAEPREVHHMPAFWLWRGLRQSYLRMRRSGIDRRAGDRAGIKSRVEEYHRL